MRNTFRLRRVEEYFSDFGNELKYHQQIEEVMSRHRILRLLDKIKVPRSEHKVTVSLGERLASAFLIISKDSHAPRDYWVSRTSFNTRNQKW